MGLRTKITITYFMLLILQSCSVAPSGPTQPSANWISNYPFGLNEVRRVSINQLQEILPIITSSQKYEIILRFGPTSFNHIDIKIDCSRLRNGYYLSGKHVGHKTISSIAHWEGFIYRKIDDQKTYSDVKIRVISSDKIRVNIRALLKDINTGKILVIEPSRIDIPSHAFRRSLDMCS